MNEKTRKQLLNLALAALLPIMTLLSASNAQAYDVKMYSGGQCMGLNGSEKQYFGNFTRGFYNNHPSDTKTGTCALTRDKAFNSNGINNSWVYVTPKFPFQVTTCTVVLKNASGTTHYFKTASRAGTGYINVGSMPNSFTTGSIIVFCKIPSKGFLNHIQIREHSSTDSFN